MYQGNITDVHGIRVGQKENQQARTGVTVVLCPRDGALAGVSVRGAAPATRETDALKCGGFSPYAHAVVLTGGSAFGLDSAGGVSKCLDQMGIGVEVMGCKVPLVPAAALFDLNIGSCAVRPDAAMGMAAVMNAQKGMLQGRFGAGCGATVGKLVPGALPQDGGIGSASITLPEGVTVGAVVAVNAMGDVYDHKTGRLIGCGHLPNGSAIAVENLMFGSAPAPQQIRIPAPRSNTTIGVVAVDCKLTREEVSRLADVSHDGLARTIRPCHTQMDGDTLFALATGRLDCEVNFMKLCAAAAEVTARAIVNAVTAAGHD